MTMLRIVGLLLILLGECILISSFLISDRKELMIVPSVAFRHHPPAMELSALAQPTDDWILYAQGSTSLVLTSILHRFLVCS